MINFDKNHNALVGTFFIVFVILSIGVAIVPAYQMQNDLQPLPNDPPLTQRQRDGLAIYIAEGCVACHSQQVRNIEMDEMWGKRPSIPSDYYYSKQRLDIWRQSPSLLGSERTGPDLTNIGLRQPSLEWHLLHLYNPRIVVDASVMPAYPWLFQEKEQPAKEDVVINPPAEFIKDPNKKIVATEDALKLVEYLQALKQVDLGGQPPTKFIPSKKLKVDEEDNKKTSSTSVNLDGERLYITNCGACHQSNGQGLKGAFPPLAGSAIVTDSDPEMLIQIILLGYDARDEYASMPPFKDQLTDEEVSAIANHERSSWGNSAEMVTPEEVKKIRESINQISQ
ncbi:cbb3-type cytochrome c oxidase subunit II [Fulvivirga kasyanovii]|uniref:C-type cytochrome n=1 Tax=Fulvivirga kasyanovii TaxID=396812 RepID=A0ABW9RJJ0_9BACT|nr:cbb3-type cytochrome c oxidase subunit II [Fulvivirga kasyanovii]MTI24178.1 c-type cytochrome [Fulvivirga kasyanovii]